MKFSLLHFDISALRALWATSGSREHAALSLALSPVAKGGVGVGDGDRLGKQPMAFTAQLRGWLKDSAKLQRQCKG